jgi:hypothetical protein
MIPKFFTENKEDRIAFVEFIQHNKDIFEKLLDRKEEELKVDGLQYTYPNNKNQSLKDTLAFSEKKNKFQHVKNTYNYFIEINVGDDPVRGELLYDLDTDEIQGDGFMEHPERRKQIKEFEKWLHTEDVKKEFAKKTMKNSIKKHHIENLKDNLFVINYKKIFNECFANLKQSRNYNKILENIRQKEANNPLASLYNDAKIDYKIPESLKSIQDAAENMVNSGAAGGVHQGEHKFNTNLKQAISPNWKGHL